jgi:hypothetical protein
MDRDIDLESLLDRASKAALESLDAKVDVQRRLYQLLERAGVNPEQAGSDHARIG